MMREELRDDIAEHIGSNAAKVVKRERNPVVTTSEVAEELGIDERTAYDMLLDEPNVSSKKVADTHVWW